MQRTPQDATHLNDTSSNLLQLTSSINRRAHESLRLGAIRVWPRRKPSTSSTLAPVPYCQTSIAHTLRKPGTYSSGAIAKSTRSRRTFPCASKAAGANFHTGSPLQPVWTHLPGQALSNPMHTGVCACMVGLTRTQT